MGGNIVNLVVNDSSALIDKALGKCLRLNNAIKRAMIACENAGHSFLDQFPEVRNLVEGGVAPRDKVDYELTRYACYLIVQNGDLRKEVIALGQTYFAIQTYRQVLAD